MFRWEWSPVASRCRCLIAWTLLLTIVGQSVVPCGCAQCEFAGQSCNGKPFDERFALTACCHSGGDGTQNTDASSMSTRHHSRGHDAPGHAPSESPCRKLAVFVSAEGSSARMTLDEVRDAGAFVHIALGVNARPIRLSARILLDLGPLEPCRFARIIRLQV